MGYNRWTKEEVDFLKENYYDNGVGFCANALNVNRQRIISKVTELKLKTKVINRGENKNKKKVNYDLFFNDFIKESCYILGLLWADGCLTEKHKRVSINCVEADINEIIPVFNVTGEWCIGKPISKYHKGKRVKNQKVLSTSTWGLFYKLKEYGYKEKKNPTKIINLIPNNLKKYWFRGFLDGDGSITLGKNYGVKIRFAGPKHQNWDFMVEICDELNIDYRVDVHSNKLGSYSHFSIIKRNDVKTFCDFIYENYENDLIGLKRKYNRYGQVCSYIKEKNKRFWSEPDIEFLKENYYKLGAKSCSEYLNVSLYSVQNKAKNLKKKNIL